MNRLSIRDIKNKALENMKFQWGASLLAIILFDALVVCGNAIPVLGALVILGPLSYGLTYIFYHASDKEYINHWDIFKGFENEFGENFLAYLLVKVFTVLWSLLFIIPGIIKSFSYSMYMYLLMREPELTAEGAIKKSMQYMKGNKMRLFILKLSFLGWDILTVLTLGILIVYVAPYKTHAETVFFNDIYERNNPVISEEEMNGQATFEEFKESAADAEEAAQSFEYKEA